MTEVEMRRLTLRIAANKLKQLKLIAVKEDTTINAIVTLLIDDYLEKKVVEA